MSISTGFVNATALKKDLEGKTVIVDPSQVEDFKSVYGHRGFSATDEFRVVRVTHQTETNESFEINNKYVFTGERVPCDVVVMTAARVSDNKELFGNASRFLVQAP